MMNRSNVLIFNSLGVARILSLIVAIVISLTVLVPASHAQIYKYRDAEGNWQFTDKPPGENEAAPEKVETIDTVVEDDNSPGSDLLAELREEKGTSRRRPLKRRPLR